MEWIVPLAVVVVVALGALLWLRRRSLQSDRRRRRGRARTVHTLERERSIGYFQDLSGKSSAPGVHEEDSVGRWGRGSDEESGSAHG